jgi:formylglycine-generating enzyme required for sulfatase activity
MNDAVAPENMIRLPGGEFQMGATDFYPEEQPIHGVKVNGFWIDPTPVTRGDFAQFVAATGYVTLAEKDLDASAYPGVDPGDLAAGSLVFTQTSGPVDLGNPGNWWQFLKGATWRDPLCDGAALEGTYPATQIAFEDAMAYAEWQGKSLPTEAEWEYAARGGLNSAVYPWGDEFSPNGEVMANTWEGDFPWRNTEKDGYTGTSPVGSYPANGYGLFDMVGNVWEWTIDWWQDVHDASPCCAPANPVGSQEQNSYDPMQPEIVIPRKVLKGGSHLCAPNYCLRYRPAARIPQMIDSSTSHIGFRCVVRD